MLSGALGEKKTGGSQGDWDGKNDRDKSARRIGKRGGLRPSREIWIGKNDRKFVKWDQKPDGPQQGAYGHRARSSRAGERPAAHARDRWRSLKKKKMETGRLLRKYKKMKPHVSVSEEKWHCDIFSELAPLIKEYVENAEYDPGNDFNNCKEIKESLADLLKKDFRELAKSYPRLNEIEDNIYFAELYNDFPGASCLASSQDNKDEKLILFSRPLLQSIHVFFPCCEMLMKEDKLKDCMGKYDKVLLSEEFDDLTLFNLFHEELEKRFIKKDYESETRLRYFDSPFDVCERIRAARRFILAHELAHLLLKHNHRRYKSEGEISYSIFNRNQEYEADLLACDILFSKFLDKNGGIKNLQNTEKWELNNTFYGIRIFFFMLEYVYCFQDWEKENPEQPKPQLRDMACFSHIISIYAENNFSREIELGMVFTWKKRKLLQLSEEIYTYYILKNNLFIDQFPVLKDRDLKKMPNEELIKKYSNNPRLAKLIEIYDKWEDKINYHRVEYFNLFDEITYEELLYWYTYFYYQCGLSGTKRLFENQLKLKLEKLDNEEKYQIFTADTREIGNYIQYRAFYKPDFVPMETFQNEFHFAFQLAKTTNRTNNDTN